MKGGGGGDALLVEGEMGWRMRCGWLGVVCWWGMGDRGAGKVGRGGGVCVGEWRRRR